MIPLILLCLSLFQSDVPYKAEGEFSVNFTLTFKKRTAPPRKDWESADAVSKSDAPDYYSPLPFMDASLEILTKSPEEVKLKIIRSKDEQVLKKKIKPGMKETIFTEFVDDIKDHISQHDYTIYFLNEDGVALSRIVIEFDEEDFYLVNGKKKGKL